MFQKKLLASAVTGVAALSLSSIALANGGGYAMAPVAGPAAGGSDSNVYVGLQGGYADTHWDNVVNSEETDNLVSDVSDKRAAGRLFVGYDFNKFLAVELGGTYIDKVKVTLSTSGLNYDLKNYAFDLLGKVTAPLPYGFDLYAKAGLGYLHSKEELSDAISTSADNSRHHYGPAFGAGLGYEITPNWVVDASWLHYSGQGKLSDSSDDYQPAMDLGLLGITYKFPVNM